MITGYLGGGVDGPGFGLAISADDKVWVTSLAGKNISVFDRITGEPLSPETGYDFGGKLGQMQGIIVTPNGDVWALDNFRNQIVYLPQGDPRKVAFSVAPLKASRKTAPSRSKNPFTWPSISRTGSGSRTAGARP
jgi:DNA-binding beta-propeller fold protein YncE